MNRIRLKTMDKHKKPTYRSLEKRVKDLEKANSRLVVSGEKLWIDLTERIRVENIKSCPVDNKS